MSALHAALVAALDDEAARWLILGDGMDAWGDRPRRRVAADRRVLERHAPDDWDEPKGPYCKHCGDSWALWPCDDVRDLAARYDVDVPA